MGSIIAKEKEQTNIDTAAWKDSGFFIGVVEFFSLNQVRMKRLKRLKRSEVTRGTSKQFSTNSTRDASKFVKISTVVTHALPGLRKPSPVLTLLNLPPNLRKRSTADSPAFLCLRGRRDGGLPNREHNYEGDECGSLCVYEGYSCFYC